MGDKWETVGWGVSPDVAGPQLNSNRRCRVVYRVRSRLRLSYGISSILREASTSVWTSDKNFCISCSNGTNDSKETIKSKRWPCCAFRTKPATDSGANRPPNPVGNRLLKTGFPERWPISRKGGRFPGIGSHDRNERRWTPSVR